MARRQKLLNHPAKSPQPRGRHQKRSLNRNHSMNANLLVPCAISCIILSSCIAGGSASSLEYIRDGQIVLLKGDYLVSAGNANGIKHCDARCLIKTPNGGTAKSTVALHEASRKLQKVSFEGELKVARNIKSLDVYLDFYDSNMHKIGDSRDGWSIPRKQESSGYQPAISHYWQ